MQSRLRTRRVFVAGAIALSMWPAAKAYALRARALSSYVVAVRDPDEVVCSARVSLPDRGSSWAAPLDRIVTIKLPDTALRDALDRVAALARVELSYSNELLPPNRRVCLSLDRVPIGAVLETLLGGTTLRPIVVGTTQIVLAPSRPTALTLNVAPTARRASVLDRVVVTGTPDGASQRGSPFALDIIDGETLARQRASTLGDALNMMVPGVWTWSSTAGSLSARYGSIRGASSFGVSAPKVYLDGIEVANPLLVTQIDPARVERVEVIRGPQGAALYGADAISGVVNILTRHDGVASGNTTIQVSSALGAAATAYAPRDAFVQEHSIALRGGTGRKTFGLGMSLGTVGAYVPGASERRILADGDMRVVLSNVVLTGTGRLSLQKANASTSLVFGGVAPTLSSNGPSAAPSRASKTSNSAGAPDTSMHHADASAPLLGDSATGQDMTQYTLGGTATMMPSLNWTNTVIVGADGYRLQGLSTVGLPMPLSSTTTLADGQGGADRGTLRVRSVGRFDLSTQTSLALTFAAEQSFTRELVDPRESQALAPNPGGGLGATAAPRSPLLPGVETRWGNSAGLSAQANLAYREAWYFVAGGRVERSVGFTATAQDALLPMLGAAYVHDVNGVVVKLRSAFGTGIRPAAGLLRSSSWMGRVVSANNSLQPESQTGTEAGIDVLMSRALSLHVTRFDQRASGLIQPVATTTTYATSAGRVRKMSYSLENVGAITNRGWELQASTAINRVTFAGTVSLVNSRVDRLAPGYGGDLRVGDRMLDVPERTYSLSASWSPTRWNFNAALTRAEDWVGYDRIAIGDALRDTSKEHELNGAQLRSYWLNYGGVTRLRASVSYLLIRDWSLMLGGDNLLNVQRGAPDNATVTAGRTLTFGLRTGY